MNINEAGEEPMNISEEWEEPMNINEGSGNGGPMMMGEFDLETLQRMAAMTNDSVVKLMRVLELMHNTTEECDFYNRNSPSDYFEFVTNDFYLPLITIDMNDPNMVMEPLWSYGEPGVVRMFEEYHAEGIQCLKGSNERDLLAAQVVLHVYIEMCHLMLAVTNVEIKELTGSCPAGFEEGEWSDESGECCCDPSNQPED